MFMFFVFVAASRGERRIFGKVTENFWNRLRLFQVKNDLNN